MSNPTDEQVKELAKKLFHEMEPFDGLTWENCPYLIAREILNDAAKKLGWEPLSLCQKAKINQDQN